MTRQAVFPRTGDYLLMRAGCSSNQSLMLCDSCAQIILSRHSIITGWRSDTGLRRIQERSQPVVLMSGKSTSTGKGLIRYAGPMMRPSKLSAARFLNSQSRIRPSSVIKWSFTRFVYRHARQKSCPCIHTSHGFYGHRDEILLGTVNGGTRAADNVGVVLLHFEASSREVSSARKRGNCP